MSKINLHIEADSAQEFYSILDQLTRKGVTVEVKGSDNSDVVAAAKDAKKNLEKEVKKAAPKKKKPVEKKVKEGSMESTSGIEPSEAGVPAEPTEDELEVSATADLHPGATKADVQAAMKKAMSTGGREQIKLCFSRYNAERLSDLKEEHYGKFITDLETLVGE